MVQITWVVPYVGTWIETVLLRLMNITYKVVPYVGTWIETLPRGYCHKPLCRTLCRYVD